jgi:hypothetical protein
MTENPTMDRCGFHLANGKVSEDIMHLMISPKARQLLMCMVNLSHLRCDIVTYELVVGQCQAGTSRTMYQKKGSDDGDIRQATAGYDIRLKLSNVSDRNLQDHHWNE